MSKELPSLLVVEDEPLICLMIEDIASDLGWRVEGKAHSEGSALDLLDVISPTVALLDINLGTTSSLGIARRCSELGIAVVFVTGYLPADIPAECEAWPIVSKPFSENDLGAALALAFAMSSAQRCVAAR